MKNYAEFPPGSLNKIVGLPNSTHNGFFGKVIDYKKEHGENFICIKLNRDSETELWVKPINLQNIPDALKSDVISTVFFDRSNYRIARLLVTSVDNYVKKFNRFTMHMVTRVGFNPGITPTKKMSSFNTLKNSELNGHYFVIGVISCENNERCLAVVTICCSLLMLD